MKYKSFVTIFALALLFVCTAYSEELPLYPKDTLFTLDDYEIGVETTVPTGDIEFVFKNTMMHDKTVSTRGVFTVDPNYRVMSIKVEYVIVNKDNRIVRTVPILNQKNPKNIMKFVSVYPYSPDYERCTFHIQILLDFIEQEEVVYDKDHSLV